MELRAYKLTYGDIFTTSAPAKALIGLPIVIQKVFKKVKWYNPRTWFQVYYTIMYIGENK